eukprot:980396_1
MLSSSSTYWFLVIVHQLSLSSTSFTTGSQTLPRTSTASAVGYDNNTNTILLFGSQEYQRQFVKFQNHEFEDMGSRYLTTRIDATGQHYVQTGHKLWIINDDGTNIFRVDTNTYAYKEDPHLTQYEIPSSSISHRGCLASLDEYFLFVVGGGAYGALNTVYVYNIQNGEWLTNVPFMNQIRRSLSCIVIHSTLYAIGGYTGSVHLATIESLDVSDLSVLSEQQWSYINCELTRALDGTRAVSYDENILVIGGHNDGQKVTNVDIIYTETGSCELWDNLNIAVALPATIIVHNVLYVFGGVQMEANGDIDRYQYKVLPTSQPTADP